MLPNSQPKTTPTQAYQCSCTFARIRALINLPEGPKRDDGIVEAQRLIQKALVLAKKDNILGAQAELLNQAGLIAQRKTNFASAATYFTETAEVAKRAGLPRMRATALYDLSEVYRMQSQFSKAKAAINAAIIQDNKAQDAMDLPVYLGEKAEVEAALHHARLADYLYIQATELIDAMLANALSSRVKSEMIAARGNVYLGYFRLALLTLHQPAKAFGIVEQARGRALADSLISRSSRSDAASSSAEIKIAQIQTELRRNSNTAAETKRLTTKLDEAYNALVPVEYERDRAEVVQMSTPASLPAIQKALLPGEALIEYVLDNEKSSYTFEITSGQVLVHTLSSREEIEKRAQEYVKSVRSKQDSSKLAKSLFASVIGPAVTTHPTSVMIIPDGSLHLVPFASLRDEKDQYWMKSVQIASAPSATIFLRLRSSQQASEPTRPFLGIAFSPEPGKEPVTTASNSRVSTFGDRQLDLKPLPYARQEVAAAADLFGKSSVLLTGDQASETALKAEPLNEFRIIHLAAHGVSDRMEPDRAGLVLAPGSGSEDGFWQAREIRRSHLSADLVTLSACETGTGRLQGEEGVMNLARSFLVAGAKSVVASLWDADDRSTATLMAHFYKHIAGGERVSDSLRKGQIEMLAEFGEDVKPYFWAGFTVIGDGTRKITSQTRTSELRTAHSDLQ